MSFTKAFSTAVLATGLFFTPGILAQEDHAVSESDVEAEAQAEAALMRGQSIDLRTEGNQIKVSGGQPGAMCAILIGLEEGYGVLPSGAEIRINPLLLLSMGPFDEQGEYTWELLPLDNPVDPVDFLVQAVTSTPEFGFVTSQALRVHFNGLDTFETTEELEELAFVEIPAEDRKVSATRRAAVA